MATKSDRNLSFAEASRLTDMVNPNYGIRTSNGFFPEHGPTLGPEIPPNSPKLILTPSMQEQLAKLIKTEAVKADSGKPDWSLVPFEALEDMVKVLEFGAKKYDRWNWTTSGGFKWTRIIASTLRHLFDFAKGIDTDPESGLPHIAHAQCNLLFLAYYIRNKDTCNKDDRNAR